VLFSPWQPASLNNHLPYLDMRFSCYLLSSIACLPSPVVRRLLSVFVPPFVSVVQCTFLSLSHALLWLEASMHANQFCRPSSASDPILGRCTSVSDGILQLPVLLLPTRVRLKLDVRAIQLTASRLSTRLPLSPYMRCNTEGNGHELCHSLMTSHNTIHAL
jgi:hypothetical protein